MFKAAKRTIALYLAMAAGGIGARLPLRFYTTEDGLPHNWVNCIVRDARGFLWFGTNEGLTRFDGRRFESFGLETGLPHRTVLRFLETRTGEFWIGTGRGLARFYPAGTPKFAPVAPFPSQNDRGQYVTALVEDRTGAIWAGTGDGVYRVRGTTFERLDLPMPAAGRDDRYVYALAEDRLGAMWIGTGSGLYRYRVGEPARRYTERDGLPSGQVAALFADDRGGLWIGTWTALVQVAAGDGSGPLRILRIFLGDRDLPSHINVLTEGPGHRLLVGTWKGLAEISLDGEPARVTRVLSGADGLRAGGIDDIACDQAGNLWLGGEFGVTKIVRGGFLWYSDSDGLTPGHIRALGETASGRLMALSNDGASIALYLFDGRRFHRAALPLPRRIRNTGWGYRNIAFQLPNREWWFATGKGLVRYPPVEHAERLAGTQPLAIYGSRQGLASDEVFQVLPDSRGDVWIGTLGWTEGHGLALWDHVSGRIRRFTPADGLPDIKFNAVWAAAEDLQGAVWFAFGARGIGRYATGRLRVFTDADGWPLTKELFFDHANRLWMPTGKGLARVDSPGAEHPAVVTYTTAQGLSSNSVGGITEDRQGRIYTGTARGIDRLEPETGRIRHYTTADGLTPSAVKLALRDRYGNLWFSTDSGFFELTPEQDVPHPPPQILITRVKAGGVRVPVSDLGTREVSSISLPLERSQLQIEFSGLASGLGEELLYQYRLEGRDGGWSEPSRDGDVNYAGLGPGNYRFLVRALSVDGAASDSAAVKFVIIPPVWQRGWIRALMVAVVAVVLYGLYRYRLAHELELERVRARIAADLHDDIGSSLSQIAILSEVARRKVGGDARPAAEPLERIAQVSRELVDSMSDIVWAINPQRDRLEDLVQRMRRYAGEVLEVGNIELEFHAPPALERRLSPEVRRNVFLIFKESLNNLVRHSGCTHAEIDMKMSDGKLVLSITDDGTGFDGNTTAGNGLGNIRNRARQIGGDFDMATAEHRGTRLKLVLPLSPRGRHRLNR